MKRTLAAAALACTSIWPAAIWLGAAPADAKPEPKPDIATIKVVPGWTYQGGGHFAVTAKCSYRHDLPVVWSKMLPRPVNLTHGGNLLIRVTDKTNPGGYAIELLCATKKGQADAFAERQVRVLKRLPYWNQVSEPALPRHFKANVTVQSGSSR
jgi:hypothetical protein